MVNEDDNLVTVIRQIYILKRALKINGFLIWEAKCFNSTWSLFTSTRWLLLYGRSKARTYKILEKYFIYFQFLKSWQHIKYVTPVIYKCVQDYVATLNTKW